jgi:MYXO-CTERM domain-containing protein
MMVGLLLATAGCEPPPVGTKEQEIDYEPAAPPNTTCDCQNINGTCDNVACTIACDATHADCNGRLSDGCESALDSASTCGQCGHNCHECREQATCSSGTCGGLARPDRSACHAQGCAVGECKNGDCVCPGATTGGSSGSTTGGPPGGNDIPGDCSFGGGGTATAGMVLFIGAMLLLFRRRRSQG